MSPPMLDGPRIALLPGGVSPVHEFLSILNRQRVLLTAIAVLVAAAVIGTASLLPSRYTAAALVSVLPTLPDPLQPNGATPTIGDDDVATEAALLGARDLVAQVVTQTGFAAAAPSSPLHRLVCGALPSLARCHPAPPTLDARVDLFVSELTIAPEQRGRLIDLAFTDHDPAVAARALNTLVAAFQQNQIAGRTQSIGQISAWLTERAEALRQKWIAADQRAGDYRSRYGLTTGAASGSDTPVTSQETVHIAGDYAAAEADLDAAVARQSALHAQGAASPDDAGQAALVAQLSQLTVEQAQLRAAHGEAYPATAAIARQVAAASGQLGAARARALRSADTDVQAKRAALAALGRNLSGLQGEAGALSTRQVALMRLDNEARGAQTVYQEFLARTTELDERAALVQPSIQFAAHAVVPGAPSFPNRPRLALAGIALGLLAGIGSVLAREHMMRGFSNVSRIGAELALPLVALVPLVAGRRDRLTRYVLDHPLSPAAEGMRGLAMQLHLAGAGAGRAPVRSLAITSATGREGKTTTCLWLASALAMSGQRVLLLDGDHRRGAIAEQLGGRPGAGMAELIAGTASIAEVVQRADTLGVDFIARGQPMSRAFAGPEHQRLRELMSELTRRYDMVLIDTPPLLAISDGLAYANIADRTVMMCLWRSTTRQAVASSLARLEAAGARLLGLALSMVDGARLPQFSDELRLADARLLAGYYHSDPAE